MQRTTDIELNELSKDDHKQISVNVGTDPSMMLFKLLSLHDIDRQVTARV